MESRKSGNTIENAKKGAVYGGLFGTGFGMGNGFAYEEFGKMRGVNTRGLVRNYSLAGLVIGASLGVLIRTGIGFFGTKNNQQVCQSNIKEPQNTNQASSKM